MKKIFSGWIAVVLPFLLPAQDAPNHTITGIVKDLHIHQVCLTYFGKGGQVTDTATVVGEHYTLKSYVPMGTVGLLTAAMPDALPTRANSLSVFLSPSETMSILHDSQFGHATITGSPANTEYLKLVETDKPYTQKRKAIIAGVNAAQKAGDTGKAASGREELTRLGADEKDQVFGNYMRNNSSSPLMTFAFNKYVGDPRSLKPDEVPTVRSFIALLPDSIRSRASIKAFEQQLDNMETFNEAVAIGKQAPDFTQNDTAGHPVTLSSFKGKYVLLDFWASWCGPCREENPTVVEAWHKYHDKGLEILGVSLDQKEQSWKDAIRQDHLTWTHVSDLKFWQNALVKAYGVQSVPQNFLIDPNGRIIARGLRGEELDKKLGEILGR